MYEYCTKEPTITGIAIQNSLDSRKHLAQLTSILAVLDPALYRVQNVIYQTITTFSISWKQLTPEQKVDALINTFDLTVNIFNDFAKWRAANTLGDASVSDMEVFDSVQ